MNLLSDIITYVRRIIKSPSNAVITDALIIDYINRFWMMDVDARIQLFDLKTQYSFITQPGVDQYNMPLYNVQTEPGSQTIGMFPVYQGFLGPAYINGVNAIFSTQQDSFFSIFPNVTQNMPVVATGNGTAGPYTITFPIAPFNSTPVNTPVNAIVRGHVDITGIIATGNNIDPPTADNTTFNNLLSKIPSTSIFPEVYITTTGQFGNNLVVQDSGIFLNTDVNEGFLISPGSAPNGNQALPNGYDVSATITGATQANPCVLTCNNSFSIGAEIEVTGVVGMTQLNGNTYRITNVSPTTITLNVDSTGFSPYVSGGTVSSFSNFINYFTGVATNVYFPDVVPSGVNINAACFFFQCGLPRAILYYNNVITLRSPPDSQYVVQLDAYLSPAAFLNTSNAIPFGYMAEYIARGAARKILADTGDTEQFQFYEPLFREQEMLVWKRSQRQFTSTRTQTIYAQGLNQGQSGYNSGGWNN